MLNTIRELSKKYNETTFRMALDHLFEIGVTNFSQRSEEEIAISCKKILSETPKNALMSGELQADVIRCTYELSKFSVWDILKFVQTDIKIDGATVHPGIIVRFLNNDSGAEMASVVVPADTSIEDIDNVIERVENCATRLRKKGTFFNFSAAYEAQSAFKDIGIKATTMFQPDHDVYL